MQIQLQQKKVLKEKKHFQVVNVLKKFVKVTTITKYILDLKINSIISKLLVSASAIEKQFIKAIFKDKTILFYLNTLS